ncbi:MAG: DUF4783 domain-containing protein [Bacteroidales bacterium]|nr:DUF4783 domain-containing protein [Bacteroidales bacterium]
MKLKKFIIAAFAALLCTAVASAQKPVVRNSSYDVFNPITKYIRLGDVEKLSAWFSDNLEITVFHVTNDASKSQAKQILKSFFDTYTPRAFNIEHTAGRETMKYALGSMKAGGDVFRVTIFVSLEGSNYLIQQIKIEKRD